MAGRVDWVRSALARRADSSLSRHSLNLSLAFDRLQGVKGGKRRMPPGAPRPGAGLLRELLLDLSHAVSLVLNSPPRLPSPLADQSV